MMKPYKKLLLKVGISFICFSFFLPAMAQDIIRVGSWLPASHTMNKDVLPTWGEWIEEATEGRVGLKIEYPGGHPKALLDQVQDGAYDAVWTFHGYFPGRFKLTKIVELPNLGADAEAASVAHWRVNEKYFSNANEHEGIVLAGLFTHGPGHIHLRKPITGLSDLKGKKIRIGGGIQTEIADLLGVKGVSAPGSKVYEILSQGVADGVFMPMSEKKSIRLKEVAPYTLKFPSGMYLGSFGVFMNKGFMDKLDKKDRDAILSVSGEKLSALAGKHWQQSAELAEVDAIQSGNDIVPVNEDMLNEFTALTSDIAPDWVESVKDRDVDAEKALEELRSIARNYK